MSEQSSGEATSRAGYSLCVRSTVLHAVVAGVMMLLSACAGGREPRYADVAAKMPPVAADRARLYFYRDYEPYESLRRPYIYLNGARSGISEPGGVFYRDVPKGAYFVSVDSFGNYPEQFKTATVKGGETRYIKIQSLRSWASGGGMNNDFEADTFVVAIIDPEQGRREIAAMEFFGGY